MTITSDPSGALVFVSSVEKGRTPLTIPFTWYGDYEVILTHQGYRTLTTGFNVKPPIYDLPPFDLFSEMAPWTYHVNRSAHFKLAKLKFPTEAELINRAQELRQRNAEGGS